MPKLPECDRCLLLARDPHLICAVHPAGPNADTCLDFRADPNAEPYELWEPEGASYYNGELILQPRQHWTPQQQLDLLDTHPLFTGRCPRCERPFPQYEMPPKLPTSVEAQEPIQIPERILQGIDAVREANTTNMFHANTVRLQAVALGYLETAQWIEANLETYCSGIFRGFAAL
ncbi:DUF5049 domain-containing protein [Microcoleus sp. F8_C2]